MDSAMKELPNSSANGAIEGTEMGLDAIDEFSPAYSLRQARMGNFRFCWESWKVENLNSSRFGNQKISRIALEFYRLIFYCQCWVGKFAITIFEEIIRKDSPIREIRKNSSYQISIISKPIPKSVSICLTFSTLHLSRSWIGFFSEISLLKYKKKSKINDNFFSF